MIFLMFFLKNIQVLSPHVKIHITKCSSKKHEILSRTIAENVFKRVSAYSTIFLLSTSQITHYKSFFSKPEDKFDFVLIISN